MDETRPERTPLDEALSVARQDPQQANFFYDVFLNSDLFVPVRREGTSEGSWKRLGMDDQFHPLFIPQGDVRVVPVFDRLEKLQIWAEGRTLDYLEVRAHLFLRVLGDQVSLSLNPGTQWGHVFSTRIIGQLLQAMKPVNPA